MVVTGERHGSSGSQNKSYIGDIPDRPALHRSFKDGDGLPDLCSAALFQEPAGPDEKEGEPEIVERFIEIASKIISQADQDIGNDPRTAPADPADRYRRVRDVRFFSLWIVCGAYDHGGSVGK